ncbi:hypothetical protein MJO55_29080 (plasmid) [Mycolicibacterium rufum]|uniref:Uncharacterized protein n=1 Tax=Mycolicibacterium rufum TaxID=318424 RepID=A0ABY5TSQ6_9MYCO|nr:hypothetical protein [Mycolicibacterium rufum]UVY95907.1 hypothetical protein MJO55_29080 [Mycolicibacterium rufum]
MRRIDHAGDLSAQERLVADANAVGNRRRSRNHQSVQRSTNAAAGAAIRRVVDKGTPCDLLVPDLQTSVTEGDVGDRWSRRLRSALLPACWA